MLETLVLQNFLHYFFVFIPLCPCFLYSFQILLWIRVAWIDVQILYFSLSLSILDFVVVVALLSWRFKKNTSSKLFCCILSDFYVPGTIVGDGDASVNSTDIKSLSSLSSPSSIQIFT